MKGRSSVTKAILSIFLVVLLVASLHPYMRPDSGTSMNNSTTIPLMESNMQVALSGVGIQPSQRIMIDCDNSSNKYALLVGMEDYPGEDNDLGGPKWNVNTFMRYLRTRGFADEDIQMILPSITKAELKEAIRDLAAKCKEQDEVVFYFAGHGTASGRQSAICLYDGNIYQDELSSLFSSLKARIILFVFDCCMAGNFADNQPFIKLVELNSIILTGSRDHTLSWGGSEGTGAIYGFFTYHLMNGFNGAADSPPFGNGDGQVAVEEAYRYARVMLRTSFPHTQSPEMNDKFFGDMVL